MAYIFATALFIFGIAAIREIVATNGKCDGSDRKTTPNLKSDNNFVLKPKTVTKTVRCSSGQPGFTMVWDEEVSVVEYEKTFIEPTMPATNSRKCSRNRSRV
jgi:hypothetical protein